MATVLGSYAPAPAPIPPQRLESVCMILSAEEAQFLRDLLGEAKHVGKNGNNWERVTASHLCNQLRTIPELIERARDRNHFADAFAEYHAL